SVKVNTEAIPAWETTCYYDSRLIGIEDRAITSLGEVKGRIFGRNGKQKGNRFCYMLMTETDGPAATGLYATCTVNYNEDEINRGWNYLYNIWLSASMFEEAAGDYFEEYLIQNGQPRRLKLYLPVQKRRAGQHIMIATESEMHFITAQEQGPGAERWASKRLMAFLQERHPLMIRNARRFYVCFDDNLCTCGMECGGSFKLPENSGLQITRTTPGRYALLPYVRLGDLSVGREKINSWLYMNNIAHENTPVFAVYETLDGRYDTESISMRLYKLLRAD
ncbi:MAG: GyrI-like domain-containing protein, partial [Clostridia bacterium]|nr:GyrI-like domain-containing protein [Clostridia bacterium]